MCCSLAVALLWYELSSSSTVCARSKLGGCGFSVQPPLLSEMAQQSPHTGTRGTAFKNRPRLRAGGRTDQHREDTALGYSEKLIWKHSFAKHNPSCSLTEKSLALSPQLFITQTMSQVKVGNSVAQLFVRTGTGPVIQPSSGCRTDRGV